MVRLAGSLERISAARKIELGDWLFARIESKTISHAAGYWSLGRIGARAPWYGSAHSVVPPEIAAGWLERLLSLDLVRTEHAAFALRRIATARPALAVTARRSPVVARAVVAYARRVSDSAAILNYWLGPEAERDAPAAALRQRWFEKSDATDAHIASEFGADVERAARGELSAWAASARGRLGLVILLDQFTRNIYRGSARMFDSDRLALSLAKQGLDVHHDRELKAAERYFLYLPWMHSERLTDQERAVALFDQLARDAPVLDARSWAKAHHDLIARFGRFPHRNLMLGRTSTAEELEFLKQPGSAF